MYSQGQSTETCQQGPESYTEVALVLEVVVCFYTNSGVGSIFWFDAGFSTILVSEQSCLNCLLMHQRVKSCVMKLIQFGCSYNILSNLCIFLKVYTRIIYLHDRLFLLMVEVSVKN